MAILYYGLMEPDIREKFEAALALTLENHRVAMEEIDKHSKASEERDKRLDEKFEKQHQAAMKRMDRFDKSRVGVRKLIVAGMQVVNHLAKENREARADTRALKAELRELKTEMRAFVKSQGNGHRGPNGRRAR